MTDGWITLEGSIRAEVEQYWRETRRPLRLVALIGHGPAARYHRERYRAIRTLIGAGILTESWDARGYAYVTPTRLAAAYAAGDDHALA